MEMHETRPDPTYPREVTSNPAVKRDCAKARSPLLLRYAAKKKRILGGVLVAIMLGGCSHSTPTVVLDGWWNTDYAKGECQSAKAWYQQNSALISQVGCSKVTSCKEIMPVVDACQFDNTGGVGDFQDRLATEFASSPSCANVKFIVIAGPEHASKAASAAMKGKHWHMQFDFIPGAKEQSWSLSYLGQSNTFAKGKGSLKQIANKVCAIASGTGARVTN
jgi:hypothetical protein